MKHTCKTCAAHDDRALGEAGDIIAVLYRALNGEGRAV